MKQIRIFGTPECTKCQAMQPIIMDLMQNDGLNIELNMLEGNEQLFFDEEIEGYPTMKFYDNGVFYKILKGVVDKQTILDIYNEV
jgi:thiol-disulfide isomerase/thioredoxin